MAVTPQELLEAAKDLLEGHYAEVAARNAASRPYCAAYHACVPIAERAGLPRDRGGSAHRDLIDTLLHSGTKAHKTLANMLRKHLQSHRKADYAIDLTFSRHSAAVTVKGCADILKMASALMPPGSAAASSTS